MEENYKGNNLSQHL